MIFHIVYYFFVLYTIINFVIWNIIIILHTNKLLFSSIDYDDVHCLWYFYWEMISKWKRRMYGLIKRRRNSLVCENPSLSWPSIKCCKRFWNIHRHRYLVDIFRISRIGINVRSFLLYGHHVSVFTDFMLRRGGGGSWWLLPGELNGARDDLQVLTSDGLQCSDNVRVNG